MWRVFAALAGVVAAVPMAGLWLRARRSAGTAAARMRLTGSLPLSTGVRLVTVEVDGREYLLGVGQAGVQLVDRLQAVDAASRPQLAVLPRVEGDARS